MNKTQKYIRFILYFIAYICLLSYIHSILYRENQFDDSYMFIRYAFNIENYSTIGWNAYEKTYGCTSFGYLFSTYLFIKLGILNVIEQGNALILQSILYYIASIFLIYLFINYYFRYYKYKIELFLFVALYISLVPIIRTNILTGIDTIISFFANILLILVVIKYERNKSPFYLFLIPITSYFIFFVRPDNIIFSFLFPSLYLYKNENFKKIVLIIFSTFLLFTIDSVLKYYYFGYVLPIPFYVKSSGFFELYLGKYYWNSFNYIADIIIWLTPFILLIVITYNRKNINILFAFLVPYIFTNLYLFNTVQIMGFESRLHIPSIPYVIALALILFSLEKVDLKRLLKDNKIRILVTLLLITLSYYALVIYGGFYTKYKNKELKEKTKNFIVEYSFNKKLLKLNRDNSLILINKLIKEINDTNFVIAAGEHGIISSFNPKNKILCLAGLHNNYSVEYKSLKNKIINQSFKKYNPDFVWFPHSDYVSMTYEIFNTKVFQEKYDFYSGVFVYGIGIRKDSKYYYQIIKSISIYHKVDTLLPTKYKVKNKFENINNL